MHDYLSKAKSSDFHYFVLSIGTVRGKPKTASGRPRKSDISTLIQYTTLKWLSLWWRGAQGGSAKVWQTLQLLADDLADVATFGFRRIIHFWFISHLRFGNLPMPMGAMRNGTGLKPNERSTKRRDFGTSPSITPSCTAHELLEMPPNAEARCSDTSSTWVCYS